MKKNSSILRKYSFLWITLILFLGSALGHWMFAWESYVKEQEEHQQEVVISDYLNETLRDTLENWQSEFLQLMWQVAGLSFLFYIGSPQSKESQDRVEEKIDYLIEKIDTKSGNKIIKKLDEQYARK